MFFVNNTILYKLLRHVQIHSQSFIEYNKKAICNKLVSALSLYINLKRDLMVIQNILGNPENSS